MTRTRTPSRAALAATVVLTLAAAGCTEKPQTAGTKKADAAPYTGVQAPGFVTSGWKAGDATAWETELRMRTQAQNEYVRSPAVMK